MAGMESLVASTFNLSVLIAILYYKLHEPARQFIANRHETIRTEILTVRENLAKAQEKYDEFSAKLKAIDAEVATLREQAKQDINSIKQRIASEARQMKSQILTDAQAASSAIFAELKGQLYSELTGRVLMRSEALLRQRVTHEDRTRFQQEFSRQLENIT